MIKQTIEITGSDTEVLEFIALCAKIELLSSVGANRTIEVTVDGDGSADLKFNAIAITDSEAGDSIIEVDLVKMWIERNRNQFIEQIDSDEMQEHFIGE